MKIIILEHEPFSERKQKHYFNEDFIKEGFKFEYWDLRSILSYTRSIQYNYELESGVVKKFASKKEVINEIKRQNSLDVVFIVELGINIETVSYLKIFSKYNFKWVKMDYYLNPTSSFVLKKSYKDIFLKTNVVKLFKKVCDKIFINILLKYYRISPEVFFVTGEEEKNVPFETKIISLNYFDVIEWEIEKTKVPLLDYSYIVFQDIMIVDHPDIKRNGIRGDSLNRRKYFESLNIFFLRLESIYGIPVVIAAHPKSNYSDEFGTRKVYIGQTANLSLNANLIVTHGSLSISYALLSYKPILLLDVSSLIVNTILKDFFKYNVINLSKNIDCCIVDITDNDFLFSIDSVSVNKEKYYEYSRLNLLAKDYGIFSNYVIFKEEIKKLLNNE
ncbi:hypothetical protein HX017_16340 [Myroides marinus]|uniref:hypothetical protein n=1 Tax=Myroides marinus TaxID=703342 RepID=UPI0025761B66|nr:hypothetical protein [Myroides marinus]MDM1352174.1 hypothetical protein [Myroides marinus]MDM1359387.1 hypothetical protein [Myroides marinus]MDM1366504.1 hypothetical protein [Myroides marinus]